MIISSASFSSDYVFGKSNNFGLWRFDNDTQILSYCSVNNIENICIAEYKFTEMGEYSLMEDKGWIWVVNGSSGSIAKCFLQNKDEIGCSSPVK